MCELRRSFVTLLICNFILSLSLFVSPLWTQETEIRSQYRKVVLKPGERCIICGVLLTGDDLVLIVRGRRVPLNHAMVDSFIRNQEKYFARLQPKSALFQENLEAPVGVAQAGISAGWFLFGLYVLAALIFGGLSGYTAVSKGLKPIPYFFIGLVFSAFGYLYVLARPAKVSKGEIPAGLVKVPTTHSPASCPQCGNTNHPAAKHCTECGAEMKPVYQSEVDRIS
ncbi:MAG: hypothetical protein ACE5NG_10295 [bacterium]